MDRTKRVVNKPARYETSSSDEEPQKRTKVVPATIEQDQALLQAALENGDREQRRTNYPVHVYVPNQPNRFQPAITFQPASTFQPTNTFKPTNTFQLPMSTCAQNNPVHVNVVDSRIQQNQNTRFEEILHLVQHLHYQQMRTWGEAFQQQQQMLVEQNQMLQQILQQQMVQQQQQMVQQQQQFQRSAKPACMPFRSQSAVKEFERINEDGYRQVINYLIFLGGTTLKEAVTLSFKELFDDSIVTCYSWLGREGKMCLAQTRAAGAIQEAQLQNRRFQTPSKKEIGDCLKVALRTAKERVRSRSLGPLVRLQQVARNSWADDEVDTNAD